MTDIFVRYWPDALAAHEARIVGELWCHAEDDGWCEWSECPQLRDGEPEATYRAFPLLYPPDGRP